MKQSPQSWKLQRLLPCGRNDKCLTGLDIISNPNNQLQYVIANGTQWNEAISPILEIAAIASLRSQ